MTATGGSAINRNTSTLLNAARWLAAFAVVVSHVRHLVLVDFGAVDAGSPALRAVYAATTLGHEAVMVFFVISGFLVGGLTLSRWRRQGIDLVDFAAARVSRLYSALVPALLLTGVLDQAGLSFFNASELYTHSAQYHTISLSSIVADNLNLPTLAGNLLMLQGIVTPTFGSDNPLWSLAWEFWYYVIFAAACGAVFGRGRLRSACSLALAALALALPQRLLAWGSIWLLGILAHWWIQARKPSLPLPAAALLFAAALAWSCMSHNPDNLLHREADSVAFGRDAVVALAFAALITSAGASTLRIRGERLHEALSAFSYSTYLMHFPVLLLVAAVAFQTWGVKFQRQPSIASLAYAALIVAAAYASALGLYWIGERHAGALRSRLIALFRGPLVN